MALGGVDDGEFAEWYLGLHPRLANALLLVAADPDLVADAVDEAFARAFASWRRVRAMGNRDGWAYTVARNVLRRTAARAARDRATAPDPGRQPVLPPPAIEVWELVAGLSARQREAVVLRYLIDLEEADVARVMGVSRSTVSSTLTDARRHLAAALTADEGSGHA